VLHPKANVITAAIWHLTSKEIRELIHGLRHSNRTGQYFFHLPLLLLDIGITKFGRFVEARRRKVSSLQEQIGMDTYLDRSLIINLFRNHQAVQDLGRLTTELTSLTQSVSYLRCHGKTQLHFINQLDVAVSDASLQYHPTLQVPDNVRESFQQRLAYLRQSIEFAQNELEAVHLATEGLLQTVSANIGPFIDCP
jgi:hypothetical protein